MTIQEYIYSESVKAGMTKEGACALLGNIQKESGFKANNLEDRANNALGLTDEQYTAMVDNGQWNDFENDNGVHGGYGLVQTTLASRKKLFYSFMKSRDYSIGDPAGQVMFILWEMQHMFPTVWKTVTTSNSLYDCTKIILDVYENPYEKTENLKVRYQYAQEWYAKLSNKAVSSGMTEQDAITKVLNLARAEIGYHEGANNNNKYAADLAQFPNLFWGGTKQNLAWCGIFVVDMFYKAFGLNTALQMLCCTEMPNGLAGCLYAAQYYKQAGRWVTSPQPGDQIFFTYAPGEYSHTGIVESVANGMVNTIEGNTSDQVARRSYALSSGSIAGYGRPRWGLATGGSSSSGDSSFTPSTPVQTVVLKLGSSGEEVRKMQEKLLKLGYDLGSWGADGDFGNDTLKAVMKFQQDYHLLVDGEAGNDTLTALDKAIQAKSGSTSTTTQTNTPAQKKEPAVGDTVNFTGTRHYLTAFSEKGYTCKPGKAKITSYARQTYALHPYHLVRVAGGESTVCGWVDTADIEVV